MLPQCALSQSGGPISVTPFRESVGCQKFFYNGSETPPCCLLWINSPNGDQNPGGHKQVFYSPPPGFFLSQKGSNCGKTLGTKRVFGPWSKKSVLHSILLPRVMVDPLKRVNPKWARIPR